MSIGGGGGFGPPPLPQFRHSLHIGDKASKKQTNHNNYDSEW